MTTLLWKEFKENAKYALAAFLVTGFMMLMGAMSVKGEKADNGTFIFNCWIYFQAIGACFGILQTFPELRRDRWSFLCHRSQSMNEIFFSKILAGITFTLGISLVLFFGAAWVIESARFKRAPFFWSDLWTSAVFLVMGVISYFAAFLCGIRQRKWYGTRFLPLFFTFMSSIYFLTMANSYGNKSVSIILPLAILAAFILGITCWMHFTRSLEDIRTNRFGKAVRIACIYMISTPAQVILTIILFGVMVGSIPRPNLAVNFHYDKEGNTYRVVRDFDSKRMISIEDLYHPERDLNITDFEIRDEIKYRRIQNELNPAFLYKRGSAELLSEVYAQPYTYAPVDASSSLRMDPYSYEPTWYFVFSENRFYGYPTWKTRKPVIVETDIDRLVNVGETNYVNSGENHILLTSEKNGFFILDTKKQEVFSLEEPEIEKPIEAIQITLDKESKTTLILHEDEIAVHEALPRVFKKNGEIVEPTLAPKEMASWTNSENARYYHPDGFYPLNVRYLPGRKLHGIPIPHSLPENSTLMMAKVPDEDRFLIAVDRNCWQNLFWPDNSVRTFLELNSEGKILRHNQFRYYIQYGTDSRMKFLITGTCIPVGPLLGLIAYDEMTATEVDQFYGTDFSSHMDRSPRLVWSFIGLIFASGTVASLVTCWIGRRNSFTRKELIQWMLFSFLLGWAGVLTMVMAHQWIGKTRCASCGKKRLQTNEKCEHCGAAFPMPEKDGTEIFLDSRRVDALAEVVSSAS